MSEFGDDFAMQQPGGPAGAEALDIFADVLHDAITGRDNFGQWGSAVYSKHFFRVNLI